ncbi:fatty acid hydroxylase domain-containing protein 2-like [Centruroides sculpturatus]|uniref:fatty acid hydroxylase domain-containing protein 2-like n=1 Tax=Centruroides sculpturatus TaxID=218467 RepID=UPI000C6E0D75|nr:fatty acid hydroxylase domain-containing protein 2-like [Centruroides sculpturatus]
MTHRVKYCFITFSVYWGIGLIYSLIDLTGKPEFLLRYKIQDVKSYPIQISQYPHVAKQVLFNQIFISTPIAIIGYNVLKWRCYDNGLELPSFRRFLFELIIFLLLEEVAFYYSHRLLHHPKLYKYIHKRHHELISPFAIGALYCHPIEHIVSNGIPPYLGPIFMGSHVSVMWMWFIICLITTLNAHSGYHFPFFPSPEAHNYHHHVKFNQNYGTLGILNFLHGTNKQFYKSREYERHFTFFNFSPLKTQ